METNKIAECIDRIYSEHFLAFPVGQLADNRVVGSFFKYQLESRFHPLARADDGALMGHEAKVACRAPDGSQVEPARLFALARDNSGLVSLDRMVRTLHALNYFAVNGGRERLFLHVQQRLLETVKSDHGRFFEQILQQFEIATEQVVIQLPEESTQADVGLLDRVIRNYRSRGYGVAVEQTGDNLRWLEALEGTRPDFITWRTTDGAQGALHSATALTRRLGIECVATDEKIHPSHPPLAANPLGLGRGSYDGSLCTR